MTRPTACALSAMMAALVSGGGSPSDEAVAPSPIASAAEPPAPSNSVPELGPEWREVVPPAVPGWLLSSATLLFADDSGIWRCRELECERFDLHGAAMRKLRLPCALKVTVADSNIVASRGGVAVAMRCGGELSRLRTDGTVIGRGKPPLEGDNMVVDDDGTVTMAAEVAEGRWAIARQVGAGPPEHVEVSAAAYVRPGTGPLLAWTSGNSAHEVAWIRATPPKPVPFSGLALVNGERLWVSYSRGGYARLDGASLSPVRGAPKGGLPPHGILLTNAPWGTTGLMLVYEWAVLLVDNELETRQQVELPRIPLSLAYGRDRVTVDRVSEVLASPNGGTLFARLADGSVQARGVSPGPRPE